MKDINQLLAELAEKQDQLLHVSGAEKQHEKGKLLARERIEMLLDEGSFTELNIFVEHHSTNFNMAKTKIAGDGVVTGYGTINGRTVYIFAQDFVSMGGSLGIMHAQKINKVQDMALQAGAPFIGICDSGGARIQEGIEALDGYAKLFRRNVQASGVIPQISIILGPCAGGAVYSPAITDFIFMVDNVSQMYITGPQVIKAVTGEQITPDELGGAATHSSVSGNCHFRCTTEAECFAKVRDLVSYLPQNNVDAVPEKATQDSPERLEPALRDLVPTDAKMPYNVLDVLKLIVDDGEFLEVEPEFARNMVVGFAHINGQSVGLVANQPNYLAGVMDVNASDKAARFIRFCDSFNIPLVTFVDTPGYLPGKDQEFNGIIRHGAKVIYAYCEATVPLITVTLRKAYGGAHIAMCNKGLGCDMMIAWPQAQIAVMGAQGAVNILYRKDIAAAPEAEQAKVRQQKIDEYEENFSNPYVAAKNGLVDMIIDPAATRPVLAKALQALSSKRQERPAKKHGNIPL